MEMETEKMERNVIESCNQNRTWDTERNGNGDIKK